MLISYNVVLMVIVTSCLQHWRNVLEAIVRAKCDHLLINLEILGFVGSLVVSFLLDKDCNMLFFCNKMLAVELYLPVTKVPSSIMLCNSRQEDHLKGESMMRQARKYANTKTWLL